MEESEFNEWLAKMEHIDKWRREVGMTAARRVKKKAT
jgi:hypothetical protein